MTQTFWLERTDQVAVGLRRYSRGGSGFTCAEGYHSALVYTGLEPADYTAEGYLASRPMVESDPRWPVECEHGCGYEFTDDDKWQMWQEQVYRRTDTGELRVLHQAAPAPEAPSAEPGATWDAWWLPDAYRGPDGIALMVRCPDGHDWTVDGTASNCTRRSEPHACWVRHGDPRECHVTVDKNGDTCSAGAGSIATPGWHGFLRDGRLVG